MATSTASPSTTRADDHRGHGARLSTEQVWQAIAKASFAIVGYVTPSGAPRSSGVVFATHDGRLYVAVAPDSWKARHISASRRVSVTVPVRRGGVLSLFLPIPPAAISFQGTAIVHPAGWLHNTPVASHLASLLPSENRDSAAIIEVRPDGEFLTYGVGVSLNAMRHPAMAEARVPV